jgi:hypothetical protein
MLNYWWVTRPKRKLNSVPEVLACCSEVALESEWQGNLYTHLAFEEALEKSGLKRVGARRDRRGGGGRTYYAWLSSLGLIFTHEGTGQTMLTLAGEAIVDGKNPVAVLRNQILKYQFPSPFSLSPASSKVRVHERFKIRPFRFLLKLLRDTRLDYKLSQEEIARVVAVEACDEKDGTYEYVVNRVLQYREDGIASLPEDFFSLYAPSSGKVNIEHPYSHLDDLANTLINWLEYTQFIEREGGWITIRPEHMEDVDAVLNDGSKLIDRANEHENFQRKYGLDLNHTKDTRNLTDSRNITKSIIDEQKTKQAFVSLSMRRPITKINAEIITAISHKTGIDKSRTADILEELYPHGAVGAFMTEYFELAFKGRDEATAFEQATVELFRDVFKFKAEHVGPKGLTPDVLLLSDDEGYHAILDNKAYSKYSISNDHHNRMVHNYIPSYSKSKLPLAFFSYIAGGFGNNIDSQIERIVQETSVHGSAITASNIIKMVEKQQTSPYTHANLREILSCDRKVLLSDL